MKGEDWTQGIEHEAQSVEDPVWAAEARRLARRQRFWASAGRMALAVALVETLLLLTNAMLVHQSLSMMQSRPWFATEAAWRAFDLSVSFLSYGGIGIVMGLLRVGPGLGLPVALAFPLFQIINGALVPRPGKPFPGSPLEVVDFYPRPGWADLGPWLAEPWLWVHVVVVSLSIWTGIRLGAQWRSARTLARR